MTEPSILHIDMDAFFASVELLRHPELRGQPVVVGGTGERGVVAAASYEARAFGIHSAMPSVRAKRLCPHAVFLPGDHAHYGEVSARVMALFRAMTPLVEPISLDEAFLDVSGARRLHGTAPEIAARLRSQVLESEGLTCTVGVARVKFLAKLASEAAKPRASRQGTRPGRGVVVVDPAHELDFLHPLPVQALWGVGPATLARLERLGVRTVGDLADLPEATVVGALGASSGRHLHALANAVDPRVVQPDQAPKSIGHEETFARDHHHADTLRLELLRMADAVATRLRAGGVSGRTVTIKVRFGDFTTITRSATVAPTDSAREVGRVARTLLDAVDPSPGVRLLGLSVSGLDDGAVKQLSFDDLAGDPGERAGTPSAAGPAEWTAAEAVVDAIRARFGARSVGPASLTGPDGLRIARRGQQQWGPSGPDPTPDGAPRPDR
ncbi:DNA polymerase IV [soil metagenome]